MSRWPAKGTDEYRAFMREYMKAYNERKRQDPEHVEHYRQYHREYARKWSSDPDNKQRLLERQRADYERRMQDPKFRQKTNDRRKTEYYRRKLETNGESIRQEAHKQSCRKRGITTDEYAEMLKRQENVCAICKRPQTDRRKRRLAIDHDHKTDRIRGLLCTRCNQMIGFSLDSPEILRSAALYLETHTT